jgi:hypothetical protein
MTITHTSFLDLLVSTSRCLVTVFQRWLFLKNYTPKPQIRDFTPYPRRASQGPDLILWRVWPKATIVSRIRLATIVTCSQPYPGYGCAIPRTTIGFMDTLATRYCRVAWLPSNRGRVFSIGTARCSKGKAIHNSELVSLRNQGISAWVSLRQLVVGSGTSQSLDSEGVSSVSRRKQKCPALELRRQRSTVRSVGSKELRVLSVHCNCNHVQL